MNRKERHTHRNTKAQKCQSTSEIRTENAIQEEIRLEECWTKIKTLVENAGKEKSDNNETTKKEIVVWQEMSGSTRQEQIPSKNAKCSNDDNIGLFNTLRAKIKKIMRRKKREVYKYKKNQSKQI